MQLFNSKRERERERESGSGPVSTVKRLGHSDSDSVRDDE